MSGAKPISKNPWAWIPTLYVAEGLPYALAMSVSVVLYKKSRRVERGHHILHELAGLAVGH